MKVLSLMRQGFELLPIEVEVSLSPGLPQILFLGLPDTMIRESVLRIKSALRNQGFEFPQARQVLVHLRPNYLKKSSRGLDLAVAMALLCEMGQIALPDLDKTLLVYGELSLKGEVFMPDDLGELIELPANSILYTGCSLAPLPFASLRVQKLADLSVDSFGADYHEASADCLYRQRPALPDFKFSPQVSDTLAVIGAGEHATLLAGPPGSGKSTVVESIPSLIEEPDTQTFRLSSAIARGFGQNLLWRPVVQTHHSVTPLAMIGGGNQIYPGEITRAHGGVLIMDEFLEFAPAIQESLREPCETGWISLARRGQAKSLPARFLLLATTNFCPCGKYLPQTENGCRCKAHARERYLSRLSGPFADRFQIFAFTNQWSEREDEKTNRIRAQEIFVRVHEAIEFRKKRGQQKPNAWLAASELPIQTRAGSKLFGSHRRELALWRVARTLADLDASDKILGSHLANSHRLTVENFEKLANVALD